MPLYVFDTNHVTNRSSGMTRFLACGPGDVAVVSVAVQGVLKGRLAALATARKPVDFVHGCALLAGSLIAISQLPVLPFDTPAGREYQSIRATLPKSGNQDMRIAAVAIVNNRTLPTQNIRDFLGIANLRVADWSV